MYFDGRYKMVVHHNGDMGEFYDLANDPNEFDNLWDNPKYCDLRFQFVKRCFDHAVLGNTDTVMGRRSIF